MWRALKFEFQRLKKSKFILSLLALFILISSTYLIIGAVNFYIYQKEVKKSINYQTLNVSQYQNYEQYGGKGFDLLSGVTPLDVLFDLKMGNLVKSNVDTSEVVDIDSSEKGKKQIGSSKFFQSYSDIFILVGSLLFLIIAVKTISIPDGCKLFGKSRPVILMVLARLILHLSIVIIMVVIQFFSLLLTGIKFTPNELRVVVSYFPFACLLLAAFYGLGLWISTLKRKRVIMYITAVWLALNIIAPLAHDLFLSLSLNKLTSPEDIAISKRITLMEFEKEVIAKAKEKKNPTNAELLKLLGDELKEYLETWYIRNDQKEKSFIEDQQKIMKIDELITVFIPTLYYFNLTRESSTKGSMNQLDFLEQVLSIKKDFYWYYYWKRYYGKPGDKVIPFLKDDQYVIKSNISGPRNFILALMFLVLYTVGFLFIALIRIKKRNYRQDLTTSTGFENFDPGFYFENFETVKERGEKFATLERTPGDHITLSRTNEEMAELAGINIKKIVDYYAAALDLDAKAVEEVLKAFDISMQENLNHDPEMQKKLYASLILAAPVKTLIINDFIRNEGQVFHERFKEILLHQIDNGKVIIYYSSEGFSSEARKNATQVYTMRPLDLKGISLR